MITKVWLIDIRKVYNPEKYYTYLLQVVDANENIVLIYRRYNDFFLLLHSLLEKFHDLSHSDGSRVRCIPQLPGKMLIGRSSIRHVAEARRNHLATFCRELISLPCEISQSTEVLKFFEFRDGDLQLLETLNSEDKFSERQFALKNISAPQQLPQIQVLRDHKAVSAKEVSVECGQVVYLLQLTAEGYCFVFEPRTEQRGWLPSAILYLDDVIRLNLVTFSVPTKGALLVATTSLNSISPDIPLIAGQLLRLLEVRFDGWWLVEVIASGVCGRAAANLLREVHASVPLSDLKAVKPVRPPPPNSVSNTSASKVHQLPTSVSATGASKLHKLPTSASVTGASKVHQLPASASATGISKVRQLPTSASATGASKVHQLPTSTSTTGVSKLHNLPTSASATGASQLHKLPTSASSTGASKVQQLPTSTSATGASKVQQSNSCGTWHSTPNLCDDPTVLPTAPSVKEICALFGNKR